MCPGCLTHGGRKGWSGISGSNVSFYIGVKLCTKGWRGKGKVVRD